MNKRAFFITGTDTSAGKTVVAAALIRFWQQDGARVAGLKPIASGFELRGGSYKNDDVEMIKAASNVVLSDDVINRYAYRPAVAPHIVAQRNKDKIELRKIVQDAEEALTKVDTLVVEGVGGWLVPLNGYDQDYQDIKLLAESLNYPVIMVVAMRLGCINHALLTAQSIMASGVPFAGWVANFSDPDFECREQNLAILDERLPVPRLFDMPYAGCPKKETEIINIRS